MMLIHSNRTRNFGNRKDGSAYRRYPRPTKESEPLLPGSSHPSISNPEVRIANHVPNANVENKLSERTTHQSILNGGKGTILPTPCAVG
jgi:hypothetical protein